MVFFVTRFFITFGKLAPKILWFFLFVNFFTKKKHGKKIASDAAERGWQDLMDRVHAGLIKEKDCAEVANGPFGLTVLDSPGATVVTFFLGEW